MTLTAFALALATLLAVPGPTNALLLASGASGVARQLMLAPLAALAGYGCAILVIGLLLGPMVAENPAFSLALRLGAAVYLIASAVRLWRSGRAAGAPANVPTRAVFLTTLLNPKAIIIALVLMPQGWGAAPARALPAFGILAAEILAISLLWLGAGVLMRQSLERLGGGRACCRITAVVLGVFGVSLMAASLAR